MSEPPDQGAPVATEQPVYTQAVYCPGCGYRLTGLASHGECPECGRGYDPSNIDLEVGPTTLAVLLRFGWPLLAYLIATVLTVISLDREIGPLLLIGVLPAAFFACIVNVPVQVRWLRGREVTRNSDRARRNRSIMIWIGTLSILWPFLVFGGCLMVVLR